MLFRRLVLCALLVGILAGLFLSAVQQWQILPLIAAAEVHEMAGVAANAAPADAHGEHAPHAHDDAHGAAEWEPADGAERQLWTVIANMLAASGFALLLVAAIAGWETLSGRPGAGAANGLVWGAAGWLAVFALPALGLPPELPGAAAAALHERQLWWSLAVTSGAAGLAVLAFGRMPWRFLGLALIALPLAVGAPHPEVGAYSGYPADIEHEMEALAARFALATALANALYWLALGALSGFAVARWVRPAVAALRADAPACA